MSKCYKCQSENLDMVWVDIFKGWKIICPDCGFSWVGR